MAEQTITRKTTIKRQKKVPHDSFACPICGGKGYVNKGYNKKKS